MPEPDVMVVRSDLRLYRDRLPRAADVALVVEVADASLSRDQVVKKADLCPSGHSRASGWSTSSIVGSRNIIDPIVSAENADYRQRRDYSVEGKIVLLLDGRQVASISVRELLP